MGKAPALAQIIRNLGFSWATADEWCSAIDRCRIGELSSDDLAAALLRWANRNAARRLAECRRKAKEVLRGDGTVKPLSDVLHDVLSEEEDPDQMEMFNTIDERSRRNAVGGAIERK